jgi:hypothetical protein
VPYLVITNGLKHYCAKVDFESGNIEMMADIPFFLTVE